MSFCTTLPRAPSIRARMSDLKVSDFWLCKGLWLVNTQWLVNSQCFMDRSIVTTQWWLTHCTNMMHPQWHLINESYITFHLMNGYLLFHAIERGNPVSALGVGGTGLWKKNNCSPHLEVAWRPCVSGDLHNKNINKNYQMLIKVNMVQLR